MEQAKDFLDKAVAMAEDVMASPPDLRDRGIFALHAYLSGLRDAYSIWIETLEEAHEGVADDDDD